MRANVSDIVCRSAWHVAGGYCVGRRAEFKRLDEDFFSEDE